MSFSAEQLYNLLPAIYRIRDAELGEPLKALIAVLAEQAAIMDQDIEGLYENWFIETCDEWVVPYIGDLLGVRALYPVSTATFSQRARVANTLGYRRRKGTATMLEQLARDTTGWNARAVEFFELLEWTQYYNHIRLQSKRTPDLRCTNELELLDTPFDRFAHSADVRHISTGRGKHNIPNVGIYLWRLQDYLVTRARARAVAIPPDGRFSFNPVGLDAPLFNRPQTESTITHLAEEISVPDALRRRPLFDELEALRQALAEKRTTEAVYFGNQPVFEVFVNGGTLSLKPEQILICDLSDWPLPPKNKTYTLPDGSKVDLPISAAVDPVLGRLTLPESSTVDNAQVSFAYGLSGDLGGGPYDRADSVRKILTRTVTWQVGVTKEPFVGPVQIFATLSDAVQEWNTQPPGTVGVIAILDSCTYCEELTGANPEDSAVARRIRIPEGSQLLIVAAQWPKPFRKGEIVPDGLRPHLQGNVSIVGDASAKSEAGELIVNGLLIEGQVSVEAGNLGALTIAHSTLVPEKGGLIVASGNEFLTVNVESSICGPISLSDDVAQLIVVDGIIDNVGGSAITIKGTDVRLEQCTIVGPTQARTLEASNCIFTQMVTVSRCQTGCVRFSFVPDTSLTPRRYRCQPEFEILAQLQKADDDARTKGASLTPAQKAAIRKQILQWLVPAFTSTKYGQPAYAQLARTCPVQIRTGADDGSEMGAFSGLKQPQREANLLASLEEYLRLGLEAGILYVT